MISVKDLFFTYAGNDKETLKGLDFEVKKQEIFGFLGPSGAGKSTTQKILYGLLKGYSGEVKIMDKEINAWHADLYEKIGISFEMPNHYTKLTALENLAYFRSLYSGKTYEPMELLKWVGLGEDAHKRVSDYSKGMKIRLNVARSLIHKPKVLFLDEPTSGLDPVNARNIKDLIMGFRDLGTTIFITTHNMMVADELCDRVAFVTDGNIRAVDSPEALKQKYGKRSVKVTYHDKEKESNKEFPIEGLGKNEAFINLLNAKVTIDRLHSQETTLDNIFLSR